MPLRRYFLIGQVTFLVLFALPIENRITKEVNFISVGQGDCTLIRDHNKIALIDKYVLGENEKPWILKSEYDETPILPREISDKYYNELRVYTSFLKQFSTLVHFYIF